MIDAQVRTTDILPTILAATGVAAPAELNGESLLPLVEKKVRRASALRSSALRRDRLSAALGMGPAARFARREHQIDRSSPARTLRLAGRSEGAEESLRCPCDSKLQTMQAEMAKWKAKLPPRANPAKPGETLPDPKDKVEVQNLLHNAMLAGDDNRPNDARKFLEKALQLDPASPTALRQLGELELAAGDFAKAAAHLKRACELRPDDSTAASEWGQAAEKSGDLRREREMRWNRA